MTVATTPRASSPARHGRGNQARVGTSRDPPNPKKRAPSRSLCGRTPKAPRRARVLDDRRGWQRKPSLRSPGSALPVHGPVLSAWHRFSRRPCELPPVSSWHEASDSRTHPSRLVPRFAAACTLPDTRYQRCLLLRGRPLPLGGGSRSARRQRSSERASVWCTLEPRSIPPRPSPGSSGAALPIRALAPCGSRR